MKIAEIAKLSRPSGTTATVPGSKSYTLRALFIAALCDSPPKLTGLLESQDSEAMQNCLKDIKTGKNKLFAGESGITARFITALACISPGKQEITGSPSLLKRPIEDLVEALRQLGANIEYKDKEGFLPVIVSSESLPGSTVSISGQTSSQYLSALLLIAPVLKNGLEITVEGKLISKPYIDMTLDIMNSFGISAENEDYRKFTIKSQKYRSKGYKVEGDYSAGAYFFAINALTGSNIKVENLNPDSRQGDKKFVDLTKNNQTLPEAINAENFPDQAMTLAVLMAFKKDKAVINGVKSLRVKETERVKAVQNELAKMGIKTESTEDTLTIYGRKPKPAIIQTYNDHRIAMSFAVAATKIQGIKILHPKVVNKTFPGFWDELAKITEVSIKEYNPTKILLTGMRGTGKTTIGRKLAGKLGLDFIDVDNHIEEDEGQKIKDMVEQNGWSKFRQLEAKACKELADSDNVVISTGGGIVTHPEFAKLKKNSFNILLAAETELLAERIKGDKNRVELTTQAKLPDELKQIYRERRPAYFENADLVIDSIQSPDSVAQDILEVIK